MIVNFSFSFNFFVVVFPFIFHLQFVRVLLGGEHFVRCKANGENVPKHERVYLVLWKNHIVMHNKRGSKLYMLIPQVGALRSFFIFFLIMR